MKVTLWLQLCECDALDKIEDCVMMTADKGYADALQRFDKTFGNRYMIARFYIEGFTRVSPVNIIKVNALIVF